jgi:hypothetical protein
MTRLLLVAFFLEVGFALVIVPWSAFWDRNYFAQALPAVQELITNNFVRGAVSGIGLINLMTGIGELIALLLARNTDAPQSLGIAPRADDQRS